MHLKYAFLKGWKNTEYDNSVSNIFLALPNLLEMYFKERVVEK